MHCTAPLDRASQTELARHWPAVLACFATAVFGWGFGFSGTSAYVAELQRAHGWSSVLVTSALTAYYLLGALCLAKVHWGLRRFGPRRLLAGGALLLALGATMFSRSAAPWQLFLGAPVMAVGWAGCTSAAISSTLALYFERQRGLAITLALNGASAAGFTVAPVLVALSQRMGLGNAVPLTACAMLAGIVPMIVYGLPVPAGVSRPQQAERPRSADTTLLRRWSFWSVALPFALALAAQVGLIVHLVSFLMPQLGPGGAASALALTSAAAITGRLALAGLIDRLRQRWAAACSFASQASGVALMLAFPASPAALYAGCLIFGLSVGNVITFPALIIQREFPAEAFSRVLGMSASAGQFTFALSPAVLGMIRDRSGSYAPVLQVCAALQIAASLLVLLRRLKARVPGSVRR